jgi:ankyrin repeat protein
MMADTQCLAVLAIYILSNGLVEPKSEPVSHFLQWMRSQKNSDLARLLLLPKGSTQAAALENIFWYALISQDDKVIRKLPTEIYRHLLDTSHPWLDSHIIDLVDSDQDSLYNIDMPLSAFEYVCFLQHIGLVQLFLDAGAEPVQLTIWKIFRAIECRRMTELRHRYPTRLTDQLHFDVTLARLLIDRGMSPCHGSFALKYPMTVRYNSLPAFACHFSDVALMETLLRGNPSHRPCAKCLITAAKEIEGRKPESRRMIQVLSDAGIDVPLSIALRYDDDDWSLLKKQLNSGVKIKINRLMDNLYNCVNLSRLSSFLDVILNSKRHPKQFSPTVSIKTPISLSNTMKVAEPRNKTHSDAIRAKNFISDIMLLHEDLRWSYISKALTAAVKEANEYYIYALIEAGATISEDHISNAIETCTLKIIQTLSQLFGDFNSSRYPSTYKITHAAICRGDSEILHALMTAGLLSNYCMAKDRLITNSVAMAIHLRHFDVVSLLMNNGYLLNHEMCSPNTGNYFSYVTPLEAAIQAGQLYLVDDLLAKGAGVNDDRALRAGVPVSCSLLQQLLAVSICGPSRRTDSFGIPALQLAIILGRMQATELLLQNAVKVHLHYEFSLDIRERYIQPWRISEPCSPKFQPEITIFETAINVDRSSGLPIVRSVLDAWHRSGKPPIGPPWERTSPLLLSIKHSNHHAIDLFLEGNEQDLNATIELGYSRTPLQCAAENGNLKLVKRLIAMGANANAPSARRVGVTSLQIASRKGLLGIVEVLLEAGADPNLPGPMPLLRTPLEEAAKMGRVDIISLLMAQKTLPGDEQVENAKRLATEAKFNPAAELVELLYQERLARISMQQPTEEDGTIENDDCQGVGADQNLCSPFTGFNDLTSGLIMTETEFWNGSNFMEGAVFAPWEWSSTEIAGFEGLA